MRGIIGLVVSLFLVGVSASAQALPVNVPVPTNAYITQGGLDWAWAAPCAPTDPSCGVIDLSYQSQFGWRLPTAAEILNHPDAMDFVFAGANVPFGGSDANGANFSDGSPPGDAACAAPYFSTAHLHCDWGNGANNLWAGLAGSQDFWEALVVRGELDGQTPIPGALPLFAGGLGVVAFLARRRKHKANA